MGLAGVLGLLLAVFPVTPAGAASAVSRPKTPLEALLGTVHDRASSGTDQFGWSVAVSGNTAIVGASDKTSETVYIYVKGSSGWPTMPTAALRDPGKHTHDRFGFSVAISGTTAIVGAYGTGSQAGATYIYEMGASGWSVTPTTTLDDPAATERDEFGWSVAVSGTTAVVGAIGTDGVAGAAYIYTKGSSGWPTTPTATLENPSTSDVELFGYTVAVSGATIVVGDLFSASAYIYVNGGAGWPTVPTTVLQAPSGSAKSDFGDSVAVSGSTTIVGARGTSKKAGVVYVYVEGRSGWPTTPTVTLSDPAATATDGFGQTVALSGTTAMLGAGFGEGEVSVYDKGASGWPATPTVTVDDPAAPGNDAFGYSVAVSAQTAIVGAFAANSLDGAAYIYGKGASGWATKPEATLADPKANPSKMSSAGR
jgi:hypothetical protein